MGWYHRPTSSCSLSFRLPADLDQGVTGCDERNLPSTTFWWCWYLLCSDLLDVVTASYQALQNLLSWWMSFDWSATRELHWLLKTWTSSLIHFVSIFGKSCWFTIMLSNQLQSKKLHTLIHFAGCLFTLNFPQGSILKSIHTMLYRGKGP